MIHDRSSSAWKHEHTNTRLAIKKIFFCGSTCDPIDIYCLHIPHKSKGRNKNPKLGDGFWLEPLSSLDDDAHAPRARFIHPIDRFASRRRVNHVDILRVRVGVVVRRRAWTTNPKDHRWTKRHDDEASGTGIGIGVDDDANARCARWTGVDRVRIARDVSTHDDDAV